MRWSKNSWIGILTGAFIGIFVSLFVGMHWCNLSLASFHILAAIISLILIFITAFLFTYNVTIIIISILLILLGVIFYNPITNNIPIKFLSICNYCKIQFYENFQNEMNGICLLSDTQKAQNEGIFDIFPKDWNVNKDSEKRENIIKDLSKSDYILSLVCASKIETLMENLKNIKIGLLRKINFNQDNQDLITQILILDQLILLASEKTIISCSSDCHSCNQNYKDSIPCPNCPPCKSSDKDINEKYFKENLHYKSKHEENSFDLEKSIQHQEQTTK